VLWDIVVSNLTVARLVLDPRAAPQPAWVPVPHRTCAACKTWQTKLICALP
jgi:multisubunit Na+/H+ antiporter MnhE subunit